MKEFWNTIQLVFAAVGGWLGYFLGGCDGLLYALIAFVAIDYMLETLTKIGANVNVITLYFKDGHTQSFEYIPPKQIHRKRKETP